MLEISYLPLEELKPYERNAKMHPPEQIKKIKQSIVDFGFNDPIAIWNGEIVEGHGRYAAAKELGLESVPVVKLDGLSDEQRKAYALVHNKLTMDTGFDLDILEKELDGLLDFDADFYDLAVDEQTGFFERVLDEENLLGYVKTLERETFNVTFSFPMESREDILDYINKVSKEKIVLKIWEDAKEAQNGD